MGWCWLCHQIQVIMPHISCKQCFLISVLTISAVISGCSSFVTTTKITENRHGFKNVAYLPSACNSRCHSFNLRPGSANMVPESRVADNIAGTASKIADRMKKELSEVAACTTLFFQYAFKSNVKPDDIVVLCDIMDELKENIDSDLFVDETLHLRYETLKLARYSLLVKLMENQYDAYVATASFLSPSRIDRLDLPNVQDVPINSEMLQKTLPIGESDDQVLVADCVLEKINYQESWLDMILLKIFRNLVQKNTGGIRSQKPGIEGLLEQGRLFMLKPGQTSEAQHKMVKDTLGGLMTPYLPPFYRIFMAGIVPELGLKNWDGKQLGPWFYAPWLTALVTPPFFAFLVGPSRPNRRKDGSVGGLLVEKCKFLQQSGCKGLCLHQCKIPAQEFFAQTLGLELTVSPNFVTQECQWSFGEVSYAAKLM